MFLHAYLVFLVCNLIFFGIQDQQVLFAISSLQAHWWRDLFIRDPLSYQACKTYKFQDPVLMCPVYQISLGGAPGVRPIQSDFVGISCFQVLRVLGPENFSFTVRNFYGYKRIIFLRGSGFEKNLTYYFDFEIYLQPTLRSAQLHKFISYSISW